MKKKTSFRYAKPLNRENYPQSSKDTHENDELTTPSQPAGTAKSKSKTSESERIIDRLDLQLLFSVIVFFVSAWAFLNSTICGFTESVPTNVQMSFIFVHYILTLVLLLCIIITAIKGGYVLKATSEDLEGPSYQAIQFFIESWFVILLLCLGILLTATILPWYIWAILSVVLLYQKLYSIHIDKKYGIPLIILLLFLFPVFISTMTITIKDVTVCVDKEYYSLSDDILISIESKGYGCDYQLVGLGDKELFPNTTYKIKKNSIILPASTLKNNRISVGTISPASGIRAFFVYPIMRIVGKSYSSKETEREVSPWLIYYKSKTVRVLP